MLNTQAFVALANDKWLICCESCKYPRALLFPRIKPRMRASLPRKLKRIRFIRSRTEIIAYIQVLCGHYT